MFPLNVIAAAKKKPLGSYEVTAGTLSTLTGYLRDNVVGILSPDVPLTNGWVISAFYTNTGEVVQAFIVEGSATQLEVFKYLEITGLFVSGQKTVRYDADTVSDFFESGGTTQWQWTYAGDDRFISSNVYDLVLFS